MHAVVGLSQLRRLGEFIEARRKVASVYDRVLYGSDAVAPLLAGPESFGNYYKYVAFLRRPLDRDALKTLLRERYGVQLAREGYELPCHHQPVFAGLADRPLPDAERACASHVCLPMSPRMTTEEAEYVATSLQDAVQHLTRGA